MIEADEERPGTFRGDIREVKRQLLGYLEERHIGALIRSRQLRLAHEEQNNKVFHTFERKRARLKSISQIRCEGKEYRSRVGVQGEFERFYTTLLGASATVQLVPADVLETLPITDPETRE